MDEEIGGREGGKGGDGGGGGEGAGGEIAGGTSMRRTSGSGGEKEAEGQAEVKRSTRGHFLERMTWALKLQKSAPQIGLFVFFIFYTAAGAKIFQALEHPAEVSSQQEALRVLKQKRDTFVRFLVNNSITTAGGVIWGKPRSPLEYEKSLEAALVEYEGALEAAVEAGVSALDQIHRYQWNYIESVFFASTVITTIGYGNMAPVTVAGRVFCILYGFVGIPITLTVIADLGKLFANIVSVLFSRLRKELTHCRHFQVTQQTGGKLNSRGLVVLGAVLALLLYIAVGGVVFIQWEDWTFFEAFYFCFITMTTIGLGDLVPARTEFMLVCNLYILIGLALTSTIIELVRRQYAESWQQMKELSGRLHELSGPLADHLKRLGEQAGDISIDVHLMKDLKDLRSAIQMSKLEAFSKMDPKWRNDAKMAEFLRLHLGEGVFSTDQKQPGDFETLEGQPLFRNKKRVIQIVIYETSV